MLSLHPRALMKQGFSTHNQSYVIKSAPYACLDGGLLLF